MRSDEAQFFEQCLREAGLNDVKVSENNEISTQHHEYYVSKRVSYDEKLCYKTVISTSVDSEPEVLRKKIAMEAENVADKFRKQMVESFEWDGRQVELSFYEGGWAQCSNCGTRVNFPQMAQSAFVEDAELSCPNPRPRDIERAVTELSGREEVLFKMYLVGRLRERCDHDCTNYKFNTFEKSPAMIDAIASD